MPEHQTRRSRYSEPPLPRVAALYCRVSSKKQGADDKASLPTQRAALQEMATSLGYAVEESYVYEDQYTGEELHQRPALSRLRSDAHARRFGLVLAYNVYALAKNTAHMAILLDEWEHIGVGLQFATEELENTPLGRMILNARTFAAEVEGERRKDRMRRALMTRVQRGKPANGSRPSYGYQWPNVRDASGRLTKERQERNAATWPIVERIWRAGLAGHTLRGIAGDLTRDGIPTPTGKRDWDPSTVRYILTNGIYWGRAMTLQRVQVPVDPAMRKYYAPAVVSPRDAECVQARLRLNQELATPNAPSSEDAEGRKEDETLVLLRGLARCGYCGSRLGVSHVPGRRADAPRRVTYRCRKGKRSSMACSAHTIEAHKLDAAVWAKITEVLTHPKLIEAEIARMRETPTPGAETVESIDRQLAEVRRRISNKRKYAEAVDDDRERNEVAAEVTLLRRDERKLEAERVTTAAYYSDWTTQQDGLQHVRDYCARVAGNLDTLTLAERRQALFTLHAEVRLYRADHSPRAELTIHLPLTGTLSTDLLGAEGAALGDEQCRSCSADSLSMWRDSLASSALAGWMRSPHASSTLVTGFCASQSISRSGRSSRSSAAMAASRWAWPSPMGDEM
jgi:site-specific DNA recombinase